MRSCRSRRKPRHGAACRAAAHRRAWPIRLDRLDARLSKVETRTDQCSGDALIEALKAPIVVRFASFVGQRPICATLAWTLTDRRLTITGKRRAEPSEEVIV